MELEIGSVYNFKHNKDRDRLVYTGKSNHWYQFELENKHGEIWCELLEEDLYLLEENTL